MTVPITTLQGIGERVAEQLARLKIETVEDMLFHLPLRYEDRTQIKPLTQLKVGDNVLIEGTIQATEVKITRKRSLVCMLTEGAGNVMLRFFHFYPSLREKLKPGIRLRCFGEVRQGYHCLELVHPQYECIDYSNSTALLEEHLTPIYPSTSHLNQFNLLPLIEALHTLHHPSPSVSLKALQAGKHPAHRRLAFEELLAHHLSLYALRARNRNRNAPCLINDGQLTQ